MMLVSFYYLFILSIIILHFSLNSAVIVDSLFSLKVYLNSQELFSYNEPSSQGRILNIKLNCMLTIQEQISFFCDQNSIHAKSCCAILDYAIWTISVDKSFEEYKVACMNSLFPISRNFVEFDNVNLRYVKDICSRRNRLQSIFIIGPGLSLGWHISPDKIPSFIWSPPSWYSADWRKAMTERGYVTRTNKDSFPVDMMIRMNCSDSFTYIAIGDAMNGGTSSLAVAALPERHFVHAFEVLDEMLDPLCLTKVSNGHLFERLFLVDKVIANEVGQRSLYYQPHRPDTSSYTFSVDGGDEVKEKVVEAITLDSYIDDLRIPSCAVLDIHSSTTSDVELMLIGAANSLRYRIIDSVFVTVSSSRAPVVWKDLWIFMHSLGWQPFRPTHDVYEVRQTRIRRSPYATPLEYADMIDMVDVIWFPSPMYADHLSMDRFWFLQDRSIAHGREDAYIGKGYVISTQPQLSQTAIHVAESCGFFAVHFPASQPWRDFFPHYDDLARRTLSLSAEESLPLDLQYRLSAGELALLLSHRRVWYMIAMDSELEEEDWALVLEEDVMLHPEVGNPSSLILEAIDYQSLATVRGFIYLGLCGGQCSILSCGRTGWDQFSVDTPVASACAGFCSHSYMLQKTLARTLFNEVHSYCRGITNCQVDQLFYRLFLVSCDNSTSQGSLPLVGPGLRSPDHPDHRGLVYQLRSKDSPGTRLNSVHIRPMDNVIGGDEVRAALGESTTTWVPACYTTMFTGRLGNLMFQYAALVGICKAKGRSPETCASVSQFPVDNSESVLLPLREFSSLFLLPTISCPILDKVYFANFTYDPQVFQQPYGTTFNGYHQVYKYFHPQAREEVLRLYSFPAMIRHEGDRFLERVRRTTSKNNHHCQSNEEAVDVSITCVSIRAGDKLREKQHFYNEWALSMDYYAKAINYIHCCMSTTASSNRKKPLYAMALFVGGSTDPDEIMLDRAWALQSIRRLYGSHQRDSSVNFTAENIFLEPAEMNHAAAMYAMSRCDNIVVSSSSFSWWSAYFRSTNHTHRGPPPVIVAPMTPETVPSFVPTDFYLDEWSLLSQFGDHRLQGSCACTIG